MCIFPYQSLAATQESQFTVNPLARAMGDVCRELEPISLFSLPKSTILEVFSKITDSRLDRNKRHHLSDIIVIAICAVIGGIDDWVGIESFGNDHYDWFKKFLPLPNGIPSHDTFGRVFSLINPQEFEACFIEWVNLIRFKVPREVVAVDGKTLRRSHDEKQGQSALHIVSAWASENNLILGQRKTDAKSNEINALPELLQLLDLSGCIVTADAMNCQKAIAQLITEKEGDYVLALKANHGNLFKEVDQFFLNEEQNGFQNPSIRYYETKEKGHGRIEVRRYWVTDQINEFEQTSGWKNLRLIGMVESRRTVKGKTTIERRLFISSLEKDVQLFAKAVRQHWGIENSVHWVLDINFREDESRIRTGHAPENMAVLRHIAVNLLRNDETPLGIKNKRLKAGRNRDYLEQVLLGELEKMNLN